MASSFLFATYTILFSWWIYKSKWVRSSGLPSRLLIFFFLLKISIGCVYGYWYFYQEHADTWYFHKGALDEYNLLFSDPWNYLTNLSHTDYPGGWRNIFSNENSDWNDLKDHLVVKFISIMHIFSFGNYYVNVVIYSFITFFSFVFLYKGLSRFYGSINPAATIFLFLTPSCLFWTSGIHKDGLILLSISIVIYQLSKFSCQGTRRLKTWIIITVAMMFMFILRSYAMLALVPAIIALVICRLRQVSPPKSFLVVYAMGIAFFFLGGLIHSSTDFPQKIVNYRTEFQQMPGDSRLSQGRLQPTVISFIRHTPEAVDHAMFRPYLWQAKSVMEIVAGVEITGFLIIIIITVFFHKHSSPRAVDWFLVSYSISVLLFIGFIVSFSGAIVRYRAIYLMLILVVCAQCLDLEKMKNLVTGFKPGKNTH